ncbi:ABC transporter permease subunit [Bartonella sp. B17]
MHAILLMLAARALGVPNRTVMIRNLLPNAMVAVLTYMPFLLTSGVSLLTLFDYLGFSLPLGYISLGELMRQAIINLNVPWICITGFVVIAVILSLLTFIGEAARDVFDSRKTFRLSIY